MNQEQGMLNIYEKCRNKLSAFEIWQGYYTMRFEEFKKFYALFPEKHFSKTLEIGCGIGYQSAFLSSVSDTVIASDVDLGNMIKHSRGLDIARQFIKEIGIDNVTVEHANAESLPFAGNTFDFIYCSYAFQYIPDKDKALTEIKRVLKKGGYFFCVLPTTGNRIHAAKNYYKAIFKKIMNPFFVKKNRAGIPSAMQGKKTNSNILRKLLPPPDDETRNFLTEFADYSPARWRKLFKKNDHLIILEKYTSSNTKGNYPKNNYFKNLREQFSSEGLILITKKQ